MLLIIPQYLTTVVVRKEQNCSWHSDCSGDPRIRERAGGDSPPSSFLLLDYLLVQFVVHKRSQKHHQILPLLVCKSQSQASI